MYVKLMNRSPEMSLEIRSCKVRRYAECTAVEPRQVPAGNRCSSVQAPPLHQPLHLSPLESQWKTYREGGQGVKKCKGIASEMQGSYKTLQRLIWTADQPLAQI